MLDSCMRPLRHNGALRSGVQLQLREMATTERTVTRSEAPSEALSVCTQALQKAGFKNVNETVGTLTVTATKFAQGQYRRSNVSIVVRPLGSGSEITIQCKAFASSLVSLASNPSARIVDAFISTLPPDTAPLQASGLESSLGIPTASSIDDLERLHGLLKSGALTDEEFKPKRRSFWARPCQPKLRTALINSRPLGSRRVERACCPYPAAHITGSPLPASGRAIRAPINGVLALHWRCRSCHLRRRCHR